ncbi:helix-turn-helix domain-containing protein [Actinacidiphila glaucinigra]|uniref:helix-turn-helix domain-containing protein n=1 Tax=Actinacidiphila glaucinigra TaxID=235986 RepID=UPI003719550C
MARYWDVQELLPEDRAGAVREVISHITGRVDIDFPGRGRRVEANGVTSDLGPLTVCTVRSNATVVRRTARSVWDDLEPCLFVGLQMSGASTVMQADRETLLRPGDLVLYESEHPYTVADRNGIGQHFFRVPVSRLALPHDLFSRISAVALSPGDPIADLTASHLYQLAASHARFDGPGAEALGQPSIDLLRAVITTHVDAVHLAKESLRSTLLLRILEYARAHLAEPGLNAAQIAAAHHMSVRRLYKILAEGGGISLADWIRTHRLEECRNELRRPTARHTTIEAVARRWGFSDMSNFGRIFRTAYGMSPREWRDHQPARKHPVAVADTDAHTVHAPLQQLHEASATVVGRPHRWTQ